LGVLARIGLLTLVAFVLSFLQLYFFLSPEARTGGPDADPWPWLPWDLVPYAVDVLARSLLIAAVVCLSLLALGSGARQAGPLVASAVMLVLTAYSSYALFGHFVSAWSTFTRREELTWVFARGHVRWTVGVALWWLAVVLAGGGALRRTADMARAHRR